MRDTIPKLFREIVRIYGIPISYQSIERTFFTHPDYPSMQSVSDALDSWKVKHVVVRLSLDKLRALDAHLKRGNIRYR